MAIGVTPEPSETVLCLTISPRSTLVLLIFDLLELLLRTLLNKPIQTPIARLFPLLHPLRLLSLLFRFHIQQPHLGVFLPQFIRC